MSRRDVAWLLDIVAAIDAIDGYLQFGDLNEGLVYDACRARLIEIGEAVKAIDRELLATGRPHALAGVHSDATERAELTIIPARNLTGGDTLPFVRRDEIVEVVEVKPLSVGDVIADGDKPATPARPSRSQAVRA